MVPRSIQPSATAAPMSCRSWAPDTQVQGRLSSGLGFGFSVAELSVIGLSGFKLKEQVSEFSDSELKPVRLFNFQGFVFHGG